MAASLKMFRAQALGMSVLLGLSLCAACKKTAELSPQDAAVAFADDAGDDASSSPDDGGQKSAKGRPRNLGIEHGTTALRPKLAACYATALATHPDEKGGTELTLSIAADGHVKEAKVSGSTLSNDTLDCLRHTAETFGFDALDKDVMIMVPLYYAPRPDGGGAGNTDMSDGGARRRLRDGGPL